MRVSVYKQEDESLAVLVEPSVGRGLPPVLAEGVTKENVREMILPVIERLRRPKTPARD